MMSDSPPPSTLATGSGSLPALTSPLARVLGLIRGGSLDAVAVLLAGQWAVVAWAGVPLPPEAMFFLAVGIWLGYSGDRIADLQRSPHLAHRTVRHGFHRRHRRSLVLLWGTLFWDRGRRHCCFSLPGPWRWVAGLALAAALYVALARRRPDTVLKPMAAVLLLTGAVLWWPVAVGSGMGRAGWVATALFAVGAALNLWGLRRGRLAGERNVAGIPTPGGPELERRALRADGLLLIGLLLLGLAAP